ERCQRLEGQLESARETHDRARAAAKKLAETDGAADAATARDELSVLERELARVDHRLRALTTEIPTLANKCKANEEHAQRWHELSGTHKEKKKAVDAVLKALDRSTYSEAAHAKA